MRSVTVRPGWILVSLLVGLPVGAAEDSVGQPSQTPRLDWNRPIVCSPGPDGGLVRIQCEQGHPAGPRCLVAPSRQSGGQELRRVKECAGERGDFYRVLQARGFEMVPALAEAPPGWYRDDKGRVFQITFDLFKRFFLGVEWMPTFDLTPGSADPGRVRFDMGFVASWLEPRRRNRHTIRAMEGFVVVEDLESQALLFAYDLSHASTTPLVRITTFFGKPARHDVFMDIGVGLELADLHVHPHRIEELIDLEFAELHAAWDIWQSADLYNHIRLRTGIGFGGTWDLEGDNQSTYYLTPNAALEGRFGLDGDGFHYLLGDLHWTMPVLVSGNPGSLRTRTGVRASYEVIFLAINDQPLSLLVEAGLDYRDDLPSRGEKWEVTLLTGLRFSFWVPARLHQDLPLLSHR